MRLRDLARLVLALLAMTWPAGARAAGATNEAPKQPLVAYLTPEEEAKTFEMQDGYSLELVLSDPIIKEPVLSVFDGNGRLFVAEMRSYMQDVDGTNQRAKNGRVSVHWSSKHDGVYDKHAIFADNLVLPRMVLPVADGVIITETDSDDFWLYTDTKGDGVADKKVLLSAGGPRGGNLEHEPSGLTYDIDNRLYMAMNNYRIRFQGTNVIRETTSINGGQWGASQDNYGKIWFVNAGAESGPLFFQTPCQYGYYQVDDQSPPDFAEVYPVIGLPDFQGGLARVRPGSQSLNHYTSSCGGEIYRGDRLPQELQGDYFFCEPVGRLIRRCLVEDHDGVTYLSNAYPKSEFIRSTDPNFRPVNMANAPDGTLYITDMYRGIIQERDWVGQGSYLRGVVQQYGLDKNFGRGRVWRVVYKGMKPGPQPRMQDAKPADLVKYLAHPNGWWRDTAQKLIVLRRDKSVVPALIEMARTNTNHLARIHALWTLEGLGALSPDFIREKLKDTDAEVRVAAIRASETLYRDGDHSLVPDILPLGKDPDHNVVLQVLETANFLKWPDWQKFGSAIVAASTSHGVKEIGSQLAPPPPPPYVPPANPSAPGVLPQPPPPRFTATERQVLDRGEVIYKQLCFACHGMDGRGTPMGGAAPGTTLAPPLSGSKTATGYRDGIIRVVLKGLSGPVAGKTYGAQMVPMESNDDTWIASVISYIRNDLNNHSTFITSNDVARVRAAIADHTNAWTISELRDSLPQPLPNRHQWKLTASHNSPSLRFAVDGNILTRYDTKVPQMPGMWVQIELPQPTEVSGVELDAGTEIYRYPRRYKVELSDDGVKWGQAVAGGRETASRNQILFAPTVAKFIRITQTASDPTYSWAIAELQVLKLLTPEDLLIPPDIVTAPNGSPEPEGQIPVVERTPFTVE